jgi:hypothetical protein
MAAPLSYTEATLWQFMRDEMQDVGRALNWNNQTDYQPAIDETQLQMGVPDIAQVASTQIRLLRAVARVNCWRMAAQATAGDFDFSADGGSYSREQMHTHCLEMWKQAEADLALLGGVDSASQAAILDERELEWPWAQVVKTGWEWWP